uniref:Uncharacterized protein n=1 Tax=Candidatus Kentrum sp. FW TaxID=2126338 RepID=A0A450S659_9GAMM|nr:MAG: Uncharacterised protein family (UPF0175) [Candidatus Kentron sp. FW]
MSLALNTEFQEILEPLDEQIGGQLADFFLAAALYLAHKLSFSAARHLAGLSFEEFAARLREHFGVGFDIADGAVEEDIDTVRAIPAP